LWSLSIPAHATEIAVWLGGTAFEGGPAFQVTIDGTDVGQGVVDPIPSTATGSRFAFEVPDDLLGTASELQIRLTNDKYDPAGGDRNLRVLSEGIRLPPESISIETAGGRIRADGWLFQKTDVAVVRPPDGQWPPPRAQCDASVTIGPFGLGEISVSESTIQLGPILDQAHGSCGVIVTGYSSAGGTPEVNRSIAEQRARAVLALLRKLGATFKTEQVVAFGSTNQFGPTAADNRRLVVRVAP
jgi:hypothetical protein